MSKKSYLSQIGFTLIFVLLATSSYLFAERNYVDECEKLPHGEQSAYIRSLSEEELLIMGNQAYIKGWDYESIGFGILNEALFPIWKTNPPQPEKYFPLIKDTKLHPGWRGTLFAVTSISASNWKNSELFEYITLGLKLFNDPQTDPQLKWPIPGGLRTAAQAKIKTIKAEESKELSMEDSQLINNLHEKNALVIDSLSNYIKNNPKGDETVLRYTISAIRDFTTMYSENSNLRKISQSSPSLNKALKAIQNIYPVFGQVISQGNYSPSVVIAVLRASQYNRDALNYIPQSAIENLKNTPAFQSDKNSLNSLEYYSKEIQKMR